MILSNGAIEQHDFSQTLPVVREFFQSGMYAMCFLCISKQSKLRKFSLFFFITTAKEDAREREKSSESEHSSCEECSKWREISPLSYT
jgi:hypothetical protein